MSNANDCSPKEEDGDESSDGEEGDGQRRVHGWLSRAVSLEFDTHFAIRGDEWRYVYQWDTGRESERQVIHNNMRPPWRHSDRGRKEEREDRRNAGFLEVQDIDTFTITSAGKS